MLKRSRSLFKLSQTMTCLLCLLNRTPSKSLHLTSEQITTRATDPRPPRDCRVDRREPPVLTVLPKQDTQRSQSPAPRGRSSSHQQRRDVVQSHHVKFVTHKTPANQLPRRPGKTIHGRNAQPLLCQDVPYLPILVLRHRTHHHARSVIAPSIGPTNVRNSSATVSMNAKTGSAGPIAASIA
jgi:hypothetical protein